MTDHERDRTGWVIFTQPDCKYCTRAINDLTEFGASVLVLDISTNEGLKTFIRTSGLTTVPQIFHWGFLIGGAEDLYQCLEFMRSEDV